MERTLCGPAWNWIATVFYTKQIMQHEEQEFIFFICFLRLIARVL